MGKQDRQRRDLTMRYLVAHIESRARAAARSNGRKPASDYARGQRDAYLSVRALIAILTGY